MKRRKTSTHHIMSSDTKRKTKTVRLPLIILCLLCTISTLAFAVMVAQNRKVGSIADDVVMSVDSRGNYLADDKRFDAQLHKSKKMRRSQMYVSQDITNLEMCKSIFGENFEFDPDVVENPDLVVAIGDVHGDVDALIQALVLSGLVKWNGRDINTLQWIGGNAVLVQTGDVLDGRRGRTEVVDTSESRPDHTLFRILDDLSSQAKRFGGHVLRLLGNHETMNVMGYMHYASSQEYAEYADLPGGRERAFKPGGSQAIRLGCTRKLSVRVGKNVFAHGGIHPFHLCHYYSKHWSNPLLVGGENDVVADSVTFFQDLNANARTFLMGTSPRRVNASSMSAFWLESRRGVVWMRDFGGDPNSRAWMDSISADGNTAGDPRCQWKSRDPCDALKKGLSILNSERLIVGHTPQILRSNRNNGWTLNISSDCGEHLWRVDTAMSTAFSGLHREADEHVVTALRIEKNGRVEVRRAPYIETGRIMAHFAG